MSKITLLIISSHYHQVKLDVFKNDKIIDVKVKLKDKIGLEPCDQILLYYDKELEDDSTIENCGLINKSLVHIVSKKRDEIEILVSTIYGELYNYHVSRSDRIRDLKMKISQDTKIPVMRQRMEFQNRPLDDDHLIRDYDISDGVIIAVSDELRKEIKVNVETMNGIKFECSVRKGDEISKLKWNLSKKINLPQERLRIMHNNCNFPDDKLIIDTNICDGDCITVSDLFEIEVNVIIKAPGIDEFEYVVKNKEEIMELKRKISTTINLSPERQRMRNGDQTLGDNTLIIDNGIQDGGLLEIEDEHNIKFTVYIKLKEVDSKTKPITVTKGDTIFDLKTKIHRTFGLEPIRQKLVVNSMIMSDEKMIKDYKLQKEECVYVEDEYLPIKISVHELGGNKAELDVNRIDSVASVKEHIKNQGPLSIAEQELFYGNHRLENSKLLKDYDIRNGANVHVIPTWQTVVLVVKLPNGKTTVIEPKLVKDVANLKHRIGQKSGIDMTLSQLEFNEQILKDSDCIGICGLSHKSEVIVR